MADFINPFDFQKIFLNTLAGTPELFSVLAIIVLSAIAGIFRMPTNVFLISIGLFAIIFQLTIGSALYTLIMVISAFFIFKIVARIITN